MSTVFDKPLDGYRFVDTQVGDTLQRIAARELGDAAQWGNLIAYNNLVPPYLTDDPDQVVPGVLLTGSQILVPAGAPVIATTTDPTQVFDVDIALTNGLLSAANGDLVSVAGRANLAQALKNNVETDRGSLLWHTAYGSLCRATIGSINGPTQAQLCAAYAKASLQLDPRVSSVSSAVATILGDQMDLSLEVIPIVGRPIQITASP
jgi:phage baseplate assembly protein W